MCKEIIKYKGAGGGGADENKKDICKTSMRYFSHNPLGRRGLWYSAALFDDCRYTEIGSCNTHYSLVNLVYYAKTNID